MKVYSVGGSVRDELLGLPVADRDYVVVGATPEQMVKLGYRPVGRDFPVFLHPGTHEEYALARTERKTARGYHGFEFHTAPEVTLEQDLARRDVTINAIARDEAGNLVDPFGGVADLRARVLRHVGTAFVEDVARAFAHSLDDLAAYGKSYNLCGPRVYTLRELVALVGAITGHRRPIIGLNAPLSYLQALVLELLPGKLMTRDNHYSMKIDNVSSQPFPFGIQPAAIEAVVPAYLGNDSPRARYRAYRDRARRGLGR